ncbi:hypothetical protein IE81DRAFT_81108 [Ceraceosorus guamensis]|uniref:Uncharacterized protein n=1 Tax=Ceraceosorus guamensis TaxID=1522189 RepID=A0A316W7Z2_9BASI|nr:hypothetical protein IE81DRAFT_81108 [Ceraceosorus guamensis]PWN46036.1 hypothetical protein IE81DRAFT_81108 [Ceraceosorus guamensis]
MPRKDVVEGPVAGAAKLDGPRFTSRSARGHVSKAQAKPHLTKHNLSWTSIAFLSFLAIACAFLSSRLTAQRGKEEPNVTQAGAEVGRNGLFLFAQLAGLGLQLPNARHSAGHAAVPGFIRSGTVLYHARTDAGLPPSPEWLAWDVEMSFAIMASRPSENGTFLHTYALQRPLRVLYLDGQSAALSVELGGTQSAELLLQGKAKMKGHSEDHGPGTRRHDEPNWWDDYGRAIRLCRWAKRHGSIIEAIVRMNTGFEVLMCDLTSSALKPLNHLNITVPGTPPFPAHMRKGKHRPKGPPPGHAERTHPRKAHAKKERGGGHGRRPHAAHRRHKHKGHSAYHEHMRHSDHQDRSRSKSHKHSDRRLVDDERATHCTDAVYGPPSSLPDLPQGMRGHVSDYRPGGHPSDGPRHERPRGPPPRGPKS